MSCPWTDGGCSSTLSTPTLNTPLQCNEVFLTRNIAYNFAVNTVQLANSMINTFKNELSRMCQGRILKGMVNTSTPFPKHHLLSWRTMESFSKMRGYHVYRIIWSGAIGQILLCQQEPMIPIYSPAGGSILKVTIRCSKWVACLSQRVVHWPHPINCHATPHAPWISRLKLLIFVYSGKTVKLVNIFILESL